MKKIKKIITTGRCWVCKNPIDMERSIYCASCWDKLKKGEIKSALM